MGKLFQGREIRPKLMKEHGVICNGDLIIPPETERKLLIKNVHDDIHCEVVATDFKGHIFQKQHTKNPGIQQCTRIL